MATPIKASMLLQSRVISPRSPLLLANSAAKIRDKSRVATQLFTTDKCLKNKNSFVKSKNNVATLQVPVYENCLLLNTPNRSKLLKSGLDEFEIDYTSYLGKGTFGTVVKGKYKDQLVAAKVVKTTENPNEALVLGLSHKNIISVLDIICKSSKYSLILMDFCESSQNLQSLIDDPNVKLDKKAIVQYSKDICEGLAYCHANGILHLDVKPKNVLVCDNVCKICDFGNAFRFTAAPSAQRPTEYDFKGTVQYAAPEMLIGARPSTKTDVYAFGITLWQLICRANPYEGLDNQVIIYKVVKFCYRPSGIKHFVENNKEDLLQLCEECWSANGEERPEFITILNKITVIN